jgi:hypothetical protein
MVFVCLKILCVLFQKLFHFKTKKSIAQIDSDIFNIGRLTLNKRITIAPKK